MRHLRALFMSLIVTVTAAAAFSTAAMGATAAGGPTITNATLVKFCVRLDGSQDSDRGSVRVIEVDPTDLAWKDGKVPKPCKNNEQELDWTGGSGATGATGPAGATGATGAQGVQGATG